MIQIEELMNIALKAGEILLRSGAEIYRVEDTITRICSSYNIRCESFVLPTGIFISIHGEKQQSMSSLIRIKQRTVDLNRIELVNTFSRSLHENPMHYEKAMEILKSIEQTKRYSPVVTLITAGISAFVFTLLFKGSIYESLAALLISMLINMVKEEISKVEFFQFFEFFVSGIITGVLSLATVAVFHDLNIYRIIIGAIIILLPGVAITNGIKDALYGDIVSSLSRLGEAVFIVSAIGAGVGVVLSVGFQLV